MGFVDALRERASAHRLAAVDPRDPEPFVELPYETELALKREALGAFWTSERLPGGPAPIVPAQQPRGYRTTTKRRAAWNGSRLALTFPGATRRGGTVAASGLDRPEHVDLYRWLAEALSRPVYRPLCRVLSWTVVRGGPARLAVILNVRSLDASVVRAAKALGGALQAASLGARAAMLYVDPSGSEYYLEARRPPSGVTQKRLFGPDALHIEVGDARLRYPLTVFSQVNEAMVPTMTTIAGELLAPLEHRMLIDLYCGYGLFSLTIGTEAGSVVGIDVAGPAIDAARANAEHCGRARQTRFLAGRIDAAFLAKRLPPTRGPEAVVLDPPRRGTEAGVVETMAARRAERILHICCGTDEVPREVRAWSACGYRLADVRPIDLFPGTTGMETLLLVVPAAGRPTRA